MDINASSLSSSNALREQLAALMCYFITEHFLVMSISLENGDRIPGSHFPSSCLHVVTISVKIEAVASLFGNLIKYYWTIR